MHRDDASAFSILKKNPAVYTVTADFHVMEEIIRKRELVSRSKLLSIVTSANEIRDVRITCFSLRIRALANNPATNPIRP